VKECRKTDESLFRFVRLGFEVWCSQWSCPEEAPEEPDGHGASDEPGFRVGSGINHPIAALAGERVMLLSSRTTRCRLTILLMVGATAPLMGQRPRLGPTDGEGLEPTDTGRVTVGMVAPDFTLEAFGRSPITLSQFRANKNVVLVFFRGHW